MDQTPANPPTGRRSIPQWVAAFPLLVLTIGLVATLLMGWQFARVVRSKDQERFENAVERQRTTIHDRIEANIAMLRATAGFLGADAQLSAAEFGRYAQRIDVQRVNPGAQGIGFVQRVLKGEVLGLVERMRAEGRFTFFLIPL